MEILKGFKPRQIEWHADPKTGKITGIVGKHTECEIIDQKNGMFWGSISIAGGPPKTDIAGSLEWIKESMQEIFDKLCKTEFQYYFERE